MDNFLSPVRSTIEISKRIIIIRSGGLGDFVLILPVLSRALALYDEVILFTRNSYHCLISHHSNALSLRDVDSDLDTLKEILLGSDVITFWQDEEWKQELWDGGCRNLFLAESRPIGKFHFTESIFLQTGWDWLDDYSRSAWLGDLWSGGQGVLWVHSGSGSLSKNASLSSFAELAGKWLDLKGANRVIFSFGEADSVVLANFERLEISKDKRMQSVCSKNLGELKKMMVDQASVFLGNDSGPGHLAASLGIPTHIVFCGTSRKIWSPLGPRVQTYESFPEASKIL